MSTLQTFLSWAVSIMAMALKPEENNKNCLRLHSVSHYWLFSILVEWKMSAYCTCCFICMFFNLTAFSSHIPKLYIGSLLLRLTCCGFKCVIFYRFSLISCEICLMPLIRVWHDFQNKENWFHHLVRLMGKWTGTDNNDFLQAAQICSLLLVSILISRTNKWGDAGNVIIIFTI